MLQAGQSITKTDDQLQKIELDYLFHKIKTPKPDVISKINQLRIVKSINKAQFTTLKKQLPYFVCGIFNPPIRKTENFGYIEYFVIDLDKFGENGYNIEETRKTIEKDQHTVMTFISPSEDGLKIMFRLKDKCYDSGKYSLFYKCFIKSFSMQYNLNPLIDLRTSDVTRACFISFDPMIYYNENANVVDMAKFLDFNNMASISQIQSEFNKIESENYKDEVKSPIDPDKVTMDLIRTRLNPKSALLREKKEVFVPVILNDIMPELQTYVLTIGISLTEIRNIQYGKKLHFILGNKHAEINIFFGKKGFSIVQSPKSGTSAELNELAAQCLNNFLLEKEYK